MAINPQDAQTAQDQLTDSAGNPITQGPNAKSVEELFPNLPAGAKVQAANPLISTGIDLISGAAGKAADLVGANTSQNTVGSTAKTGRAETDQQNLDALKDTQRFTLDAQKGAQGAAGVEERLASPAGKDIKGTGLDLINQGQVDSANNAKTRDEALKQSGEHLVAAENALKEASAKAKIDPEQYLSNMGIGSKILTGLGLVLSGIGSGLTGQPNMAISMLQNNLDRNIGAQKQSYINAYNQAQGHIALAQSAKERAVVANAAQQAATITVNTGALTALQGLQTQISGESALQRYNLLSKTLQDSYTSALTNYNSIFSNAYQANDIRTLNALGGVASTVADTLSPKGKEQGLARPQPTNRATEQNKQGLYTSPTSIAPVQEQPQPSSQEPIFKGGSNSPVQQSFLDKLAEAGSKK